MTQAPGFSMVTGIDALKPWNQCASCTEASPDLHAGLQSGVSSAVSMLSVFLQAVTGTVFLNSETECEAAGRRPWAAGGGLHRNTWLQRSINIRNSF